VREQPLDEAARGGRRSLHSRATLSGHGIGVLDGAALPAGRPAVGRGGTDGWCHGQGYPARFVLTGSARTLGSALDGF
jgi:hypothetical protein